MRWAGRLIAVVLIGVLIALNQIEISRELQGTVNAIGLLVILLVLMGGDIHL